MRRSSYEREWGRRLDEPNFFERFLAVLLKLIPPIGPLRTLQLKIPNPQSEQLFMSSFNHAVTDLQHLVEERASEPVLANKNYDTGTVTPRGVYPLSDETEDFWQKKLAERKASVAQ